MGIQDDSSSEYSLLKLSCWATTHLASKKKKTNKKEEKKKERERHRGPKVVRDIKIKIMHHKRQC